MRRIILIALHAQIIKGAAFSILAAMLVGVATAGPFQFPLPAGIWTYDTSATNQGVLIMGSNGNFTAVGLLNGAWYGYNGTVHMGPGGAESGTVIYNFPANLVPGDAGETGYVGPTCESCADQLMNGLEPTANVTIDQHASALVFTDNADHQSWTYHYLSSDHPITSLSTAQASWNTLVSGGEPSYPHYDGWGNPYPVSAVGNGGLGDCLNSGTISSDIPALGIYLLTCTQAYDAANGVGVFNPSTTVVATGLLFMNVSGEIFGAMSDPGLFENVSYPATAVIPSGASIGVPEPSPIWMAVCGLVCLGYVGSRRKLI